MSRRSESSPTDSQSNSKQSGANVPTDKDVAKKPDPSSTKPHSKKVASTKSEQSKSKGQEKSDNKKPDDKPNDMNPDDMKPDDTKDGDKKNDDKKNDDKKAGDKKPDQKPRKQSIFNKFSKSESGKKNPEVPKKTKKNKTTKEQVKSQSQRKEDLETESKPDPNKNKPNADKAKKKSQIRYSIVNPLGEESKKKRTSYVLSSRPVFVSPSIVKNITYTRRNTLYLVEGAPSAYGMIQNDKINSRMESFLSNPEKVLNATTVRNSCAYFIRKEGRQNMDLYLTSVAEVKDFVQGTLNVLGVEDDIATIFTTAIIESDLHGFPRQGLASFIDHVLDVTGKTAYSNVLPEVIEESGAIAWVDGQRALGPILGKFCMELAMMKASKAGIGFVSVKNAASFYYGYWIAQMARKEGFLGLWCSNTSPMMCPTGGMRAVLGMQPFTFSSPAGFDKLMVHVLATSLSLHTLNEHLETNTPLPDIVGYSKNKTVTNDPKELNDAKCFLPLGLTRMLGSPRGYGFGIIVEVLTGILSGSRYGPFVVTKEEIEDEAMDLGQCFIAIDPDCFAENFEFHMGTFLDELKNLEPVDENKPVLVPGEVQSFHKRMLEEQGGIIYPKSVIKATNFIAQKLHIDAMKVNTVK